MNEKMFIDHTRIQKIKSTIQQIEEEEVILYVRSNIN